MVHKNIEHIFLFLQFFLFLLFFLNLTKKILKIFKKNNLVIITVNVTKIVDKKFKIIFIKYFRSIKKNIIIYKNPY